MPGDPGCKDQIHSDHWYGTDNYVPYELVGSLLRLNSVGNCYAQDSVEHDRETLDGLGFLKSALVEYSDDSGHKEVWPSKANRCTRTSSSIKIYAGPKPCHLASFSHPFEDE